MLCPLADSAPNRQQITSFSAFVVALFPDFRESICPAVFWLLKTGANQDVGHGLNMWDVGQGIKMQFSST